MANYQDAVLVENNRSYLAYASDDNTNTDSVAWLYNSTTGKLLWTVRVHYWGADVYPVDLDNDGKVDLLISMRFPTTEFKVFKDRSTVPSADHNWTGLAMYYGAQDITGDGFKDLFFLTWPASSNNTNYTLEARNGKDLSLIWSSNLTNLSGDGLFYHDISRWMDLNGDGVPDPVLEYHPIDVSPKGRTLGGVIVLDGKNGNLLIGMSVGGDLEDWEFLNPSSMKDLSSYVLWTNHTGHEYLNTLDSVGHFVSAKAITPKASEYYQGAGYFEQMSPGKKELFRLLDGNTTNEAIVQFYSVPDLVPLWNVTLRNATKDSYVDFIPDINKDGYKDLAYVSRGLWLYSGSGSGLIRYIPFNETNLFKYIFGGRIAFIEFDASSDPPFWYNVYDLSTGDRILTFNGTDQVRGETMADIDGDLNPELIFVTDNFARSQDSSARGRIEVYDLDPSGGPKDPGGGGTGGTAPGKKTPTRVMSYLEDPYSLLLLVVVIAGVCITIFYEYFSWRRKDEEDTMGRLSSIPDKGRHRPRP